MSPPITANGTHGLPTAVTSAIMVASVVVLFALFIFFLILYLRSTLYMIADHGLENSFNSFDGGGGGPPVSCRALHPAVLKTLPASVFSSVDSLGNVECAVCLSDLADGEHFRVLPLCNHPFHTDCIDIWFSSNSTCPICRSTVESPKTEILNDAEASLSVNNSALPPWIGTGRMAMPIDGTEEGSSSSAASNQPGRIVAVHVPRNTVESSASALQSGETPAAEEVKMPTLVSSRIRGCCSRGWDIEQGVPPPAITVGGRGYCVEREREGRSSS